MELGGGDKGEGSFHVPGLGTSTEFVIFRAAEMTMYTDYIKC